jgi:hypothetical protein
VVVVETTSTGMPTLMFAGSGLDADELEAKRARPQFDVQAT